MTRRISQPSSYFDVQNLARYIPGGMFRCLWDERLTLMEVSDGFLKMLGYSREELHDVFGDSVRAMIDPRDWERILADVCRQLESGNEKEIEYRMKRRNGDVIWVLDKGSLVTAPDGAQSFYCLLVDITAMRADKEELARLSRKDALTGLLNKSTAFDRVRQRIETADDGARFALMIIDVDNFKLVNDTMGHLFGDEFLADVARRISGLFRGNDLLGRIGGDEFLVFMDGLPDAGTACRRAEQVLESFGGVTTEAGLCEVSCSIGIALYPSGGRTFQELFHHADQAMYLAKQRGKKQYLVYDGAAGPVLSAAAPLYERPAALTETGSVLLQLGERALDLLLREEPTQAIGAILEMAGRRFDVSRVYVFESSPDGSFTRNTFEWCGDGVEPQIENLQYLTFDEDLKDVYELFNEEGVLYCRDVCELPDLQRRLLQAQGIRAMLQVALIENKTIRLVVGFDECRRTRFWSGEQIECLRLLSKILLLSGRLTA